ncbi:hypothetical protein THRCLA_01250 [Thraustotheca clavata]|uniref:Uncharacterized protein n=1 Tax=Thraustotheca clavata TaxID=74557 RepID=A0A1W0A8W7_9STRA|nr:hypothetical protein THRCLA_01250 [Thraustotheca clavata]
MHDLPPRLFPRSPQIGSLPDPSFAFLHAPMPPLELPPMNRDSLSEERFASPLNPPTMLGRNETVVQFASSCPAQLDGFMTRMTLEESQGLLSQSPSLAVLRDMRRHSSFLDQRRSLDQPLIDERDEYDSSEEDEDEEDDSRGLHRDSQEDIFNFEMP